MADKKVTALTDLGDNIAAADLFHVVDDPTGTPINKKVAAEDVFNNIPSWLGLKATSQSITGDGSTQLSTVGAGHAGWNLRVAGSGGRANRVQVETLVALTNAA